jgi:flagellum-specific ATP synthase
VLDAFGTPLDDGPPPPAGLRVYPLDGSPVPAHRRRPLGPRLELGLRALDLFTPCRRGQRLGLFAGTGVGKSTALAMAARRSGADALVVALIGERGRELLEFVRETLGADGLARSVVVAATSDQPPLVRRRAAHAALAIAEALRDDGLDVLLLFDSVTRYAMALREIHLAAGEPPTARGYPPSVFAALPRLLERAGTGAGPGSITALFSVLVEGDDTEEPIADAVRGILDGHVVFDRRLAERGLYPAIDVLRSLSRSAPGCYAPEEAALVLEARRVLALAGEMAELVQLGAYKAGTDPAVDRALRLRPLLERLIAQAPDEPSPTGAADGWAALRALLADGTAAAPGGPADGT